MKWKCPQIGAKPLKRLRITDVLCKGTTSQVVERLDSMKGTGFTCCGKTKSGGRRGFNPRTKQKESVWALAPEECSSPIERESRSFSPACLFRCRPVLGGGG